MDIKTPGDECLRKTWEKEIRILMVLIIFSTIILSGEVRPASAYTAPYRLMVFTDKQVYLDFAYTIPDAGGPPTAYAYTANANFTQDVTLFALLLDSDGNIVRSGLTGSNFSATLKDTARLNHTTAVPDPYINVIPTNGAYYNGAFPTFTDPDGDGIYSSNKTNTPMLQLGTLPPLTDHLNISLNVTVRYEGINYTSNVSIIFGNAGCRHPTNAITSAHGSSNHNDVPCTVCHWGYQYNLGIHGPNNSPMYNDAARYLGTPAWTTYNSAPHYDYRLGYRNLSAASPITTWDNSNGGYCVMCHGGPLNRNILDLGVGSAPSNTDQNGDGLPDNNRPSCSWYQGPLGNNSAYPGCHGPAYGSNGSTKIAVVQLFNVDWKGWSQRFNRSKVHNHSSPPNTNGVPCELCHAGGGAPGTGTGGLHAVSGLPNRSTDYISINDQCWNCHNRTDGWLNITSNGGTAVNHSRTDQCSNCHNENNKLNVHNVPTGAFGGRWCLNCHNLTGKAPIDHKVDPSITNISNQNYIHYELNNKSDAANSSRICWGCHTNDSLVVNGAVNSTDIPLSQHPDKFDQPRKCTDCHNNTNDTVNFGAPQVHRHTWYAPIMKATAVTYCVNCHAQDEMINTWSEGVYPPKTANESSSHYGKNRSSFFEPLIGSREYCGYCHQNESTVMGPFAKASNKVRSDHASRATTPGCGNPTCHRPGRMHEDTLTIPNFTEANIATTCQSCHNSSNYNFHNGNVTCWDCHMGNVSNTDPTWIHPIQFIQYNGNFTGAKLTGATCYDCHKSTRVDSTINNLSGRTPPKVYNQAHSFDPINGTKWGDYWKYTPTTYEFADYMIIGGNGSIDPSYPFENIKVPSNDYMQLNETKIGSSNGGAFPYNSAERQINGPPVPNWTSSSKVTQGTTTLIAIQDANNGNPAGSLKSTLKTSSSSGSGSISWNYSFYYKPNSTQFAFTNASVDYNINVSTARTQNVYFRLIKPSGAVVTLANASCCATAGASGWITLSNNSFGPDMDEDGSVVPYRIQLYAVLSGARPTTNLYTVYFDNIFLKLQEKVWNRYEIVINTTGVPVNGSSKLGMSYQVHNENTSLMIYNRTSQSYEFLDIMDKGVFFDYVRDINSTHHINSTDGITGNVSVKFVDTDQSDTDSVSDVLHIRYLYVYTYSGLQYPCAQCHSPNKHYVYPTLGSPAKFNAGNIVNQSISSSGTWCQQCHWQGAANYSLMIQEYSVTRKPPENIPPEITGNATYAPLGGARDGTPYKDHIGLDLSDLGCFSCHGGSLSQSAGMTAFMHGVSEGMAGGPNCTNCHNTGQIPPKLGALVNFTAMDGPLAIHRNLNSNATSPSGYPAENKKCWACHGDGSEPAAGNHPNGYNIPKSCGYCHTNGSEPYGALQISQHYWNGTSINTSAATSCYNCHNKSEMMVGSVDPDGASTVYSGANGGNNSTSHYGKKRSDMAAMDTGTYCSYCHNTSTNNATFSVSDFNNTIFNHTSRATTPLCSTCHNTGRLHDSTLVKPVSNDSYCSTCHGAGGSAATNNKAEHKSLYCTECHANSSSGTLAGKDIHAIKYLTQSNMYSTLNSSAVNCVTCHQTSNVDSSLGSFAPFKIMNPMRHSDNISNGSVWGSYWATPQAACVYCHNNTLHNTTPLGRILQWSSNYSMYASIGTNLSCSDCHYKGDAGYGRMNSAFTSAGLPIPPEITNGTNWKGISSNYYNHSLGSYDDQTCKSCHGSLLSGSANMSEFTHNAATGVAGGANCTACHNTGGSAGSGKLINFTAAGDANTIHRNLNSGANSALPAENKKCWACHGNGSEPSGHPSNYRTPYNCTDCHVPGAGQNLNYSPANILNVTQHYWNGISIDTPAATSCYDCHNRSEMMLGLALDPDGAATIYGGANGGNNSASHYGKKRTDYPVQGTNDYCYKCHNNLSATSVFPYLNSGNATIANHSISYPPSNPDCNSCHATATGRLHNSTLYKPPFNLPNSTYCLSCHGPGGSATIKNLERHNGTTGLNCTQCHLNSTKSIHPVRYLQQDSTWNTSKTRAVNCTSCHQTIMVIGSNTATLTPNPMNHSTDPYSGALWNNTQPAYWTNTSQQSSCDYCHGRIAYHNSSGLGNITRVKSGNTARQDLSTGRWCANCHYAGAAGYAGSSFYPEPPEILNASGKVPLKARDNTSFYNHSQDVAAGYNDSRCKTCHNNSLATDATSLNFSHNLAPGAGGPNCIGCHYIGAGVQNINVTAINDSSSIHRDLNKGASVTDNGYNDSKKCWACHGDGSQPTGHPARYKTPYNCTDCHTNSSLPYSALQVSQHYWNGTSIRTPAVNNCYVCHNTTGMIIAAYDPDGASANIYGGASGGNDSVSHYGRKRGDMAAQQNTTQYCDNCHKGSSAFPFIDNANRTIANHSLGYPATNPACRDCHDGGRIHNNTLYKTSIGQTNSTYCLGCHGTPGSLNATIRNLERHNGTGTSCTQCHMNTSDSIHPVRYLKPDNTWDTSSANAANCTSCHQGPGMGSFGSAPKVPILIHSTNAYSGALWNGTQPGFWTNTSQQSGCDYCHGIAALHNTSGLGNITKVKGTNTVRQGFTGGYWCANCHYGNTANYSGTQFTPQPPEVLNRSGFVPPLARDSTQFYNHSTDLVSGYDDAKCKKCHDNNLGVSATSLNFTHSLGFSSGGPNCTGCHGLGGSLADGKRVNHTAMNSSLAIHKDLNRDAQASDSNYTGNKKCWACHGDGTEPGGHPARYRTPYNCVDCHVPGPGQNMNYNPNNTLLNVTQHYWNGTSIGTSAAGSCYDCHNKSEMMAGMALDPDGAATVFGGANGGNLSVSHYGKKRNDMAGLGNTTYCNYCHNNQSGAFPFINNSNRTIANHSMNYASTNPACRDCHEAGRLHNSTLYKPAFTLSNGTYCLSCHGNNGTGGTNYTGAVTAFKEEHNNSLCAECHLNSTGGIHSVRYLRYNSTWGTTNGSAANCTTCHQGAGMSGFASAPLVQTPIWHSNSSYSGALWNGTQPRFWDNRSQLSSCDYCHGKASLHNASALGKSSIIQAGNSKNQSLTGSYWCANCHFNGSSPGGRYKYMGNSFNPIPPEILNLTGLLPANSSIGMPFQNHTTNIGGDFSDTRCKTCHGKDSPSIITSAIFVHRLNESAPETGGPDCLKCHASTATFNESEGTPMDMRVNKTAFTNYGVHRNMNSNASSTVILSDNRSKACWACHGDGTQPIKHHVDYTTPKSCDYCHVNSSYNATLVSSHYPGAVFLGGIVYNSSDPGRKCVSCHNNSLVANLNITFGSASATKVMNASVSHYTVNRSMGVKMGMGAVTGVLPNTTYINGCRVCHAVGGQYGVWGPSYGNARALPSGHNDMGSTPEDCEKSCHNSAVDDAGFPAPVDLHNSSVVINIGESSCYSTGCHPDPAAGDGGGPRR